MQAALGLNSIDNFFNKSFADHLKLVIANDYSAYNYKTVQVLDLSDAPKTCLGLTDFPIICEY